MFRTVEHVKKNDLVQVIAGKEKGKTGKVLRVAHKTNRVVVEKLNMIKRHKKPAGKTPGGIMDIEGPMAASNVLLFCDKCGRGVRTARRAVKGDKKARFCKKCNSQLDK